MKPRRFIAGLALSLLLGLFVASTVGPALGPHAAPSVSHVVMFTGSPAIVTHNGSQGAGSRNVSTVITVTSGDLLVAFESDLNTVAGSGTSDSLANHWTVNTSKTDGTWTTNLSVAVAATSGADTVHFHVGGGAPANCLLSVWDVSGSVGYIENTSAMTAYTATNKSTSLTLDHANALVGIVGIFDHTTPDGISVHTDPSLTFASSKSIVTGSFAQDELWMSPSNGTGATPVDVAHNVSANRLSGMSFYIDPVVPVVGGGGGTLNGNPNAVGFLFLALVASAVVFTLFFATRDRR